MLWLRHLMPFVLLAALVGSGSWAYHEASEWLDEWLRQKIIEELHKEDLHAEMGRLSLAPLSGAVVARKFRLYGGPGRQLLLGTFDELRLEVDPSRLWQKQQFINHIDLRDAAVSLPVDPEDPQTKTIDLVGVNAHVRASGDRFEIRHAQGMIAGIRVTMDGSLLRPSKIKKEKDGSPKDKKEALAFLKERRGFLELVFEQLAQLNYRPGLQPPHLHLRVEGDLDQPENLHVLARLKGENFAYGDYAIVDLAATIEVVRGDLLLRELRLRDSAGVLHGQGRFERGRRDIPFEFTSTANLPALVGAVRPLSVLNEFVLYEPGSLNISAEGTWSLPSEGEEGTGSLRLLGTLSSGRFATRGAIFKGLHGEFFVRGRDVNFRQVKLEHETGTLEGQAMRLNDVWRYQVQMQMSPEALKPFIEDDGLRAFLGRLDFDASSTVEIDAEGTGRSEEPESWTHQVRVNARQFRFDNEWVRRFAASLSRAPGFVLLDEVRLARPEGEMEVARLHLDEVARKVRIESLRGSVYPVPVLRWISPKLATELKGLKVQEPPEVEMSGVVGVEDARLNDFQIDFSLGGVSQMTRREWQDRPLMVREGKGRLIAQGADFQLDVRGTLLPPAAWGETTLEEPMEGRFITQFSLLPEEKERHTWQLFLHGPAKASHVFDGLPLPVELQRVAVDYRAQRPGVAFPSVQTEVTGKIRGGARHSAFTLVTDAEAQFAGVFEINSSPGHDRSRWTFAAHCPGMVEYPLAGKKLPLQNASLTAAYREGRVHVSEATAHLLGGTVRLTADMEPAAATRDYSLKLTAEDVSFGSLAELFSPGTSTGGKLSGTLQLAGQAIPQGAPPQGGGELTLQDGDIFALPLLGPLSPLIDAVLPGTKTGYSKARKASASFRIQDRKFITQDFEALTNAFVIKGEGTVELDSRRLDLLARLNTRGPAGVLLYPVSKLLEYEAKGTTAEPGWKPRVLSLPGRLLSPE